MKLKTIFFFVFIAFLIVPHIYDQYKIDKKINKGIDESQTQLEKNKSYSINQSGYVKGIGASGVLTEERINRQLKKMSPKNRAHTLTWKWQNKKNITISAQGLDNLHHFVNSYLVGFQPFKTDKLWIPLYTLGIKKRYQYDHLQHSGLADVWQNSLQAFYYARGDCEDHSVALADWLICLGKDARVVLGDHNGNGHAWVVLLHNDMEYILEATSKRKANSMNNYPLAALSKGYHPKFQFNRTEFWVNTGSKFTTEYRGGHWELRSRYKKKSLRSKGNA